MWQLVVTALLLAASPAAPGPLPAPTARVLVSRGSIDILRQAGLSREVAGGGATDPAALVVAGDRIVLRDKASISIQDPVGVLQFMGPGEARVVSFAQYYWKGERAVIAAQGGSVQVSVEGGTIQVASGSVRLRQGDRGIVIEVLGGGDVAVIGPAGVTTLKSGAGILLRQAGLAAKPAVLPDAPQLLLPAAHSPLRTFRFKWRSVPDAVSYRLEMSRDPLFQDIVYAQESTTPVISDRARSLPVGLLFWRVATRSEAGFEGIPSEARAVRVAP